MKKAYATSILIALSASAYAEPQTQLRPNQAAAEDICNANPVDKMIVDYCDLRRQATNVLAAQKAQLALSENCARAQSETEKDLCADSVKRSRDLIESDVELILAPTELSIVEADRLRKSQAAQAAKNDFAPPSVLPTIRPSERSLHSAFPLKKKLKRPHVVKRSGAMKQKAIGTVLNGPRLLHPITIGGMALAAAKVENLGRTIKNVPTRRTVLSKSPAKKPLRPAVKNGAVHTSSLGPKPIKVINSKYDDPVYFPRPKGLTPVP